MYSALKNRFGIVLSAFLSALVFSALHANLIGFAPILALGVLLAVAYEVTGSLLTPIIIHVIHNSAMLFLITIGKEIAL
jgi:hypothetical protein